MPIIKVFTPPTFHYLSTVNKHLAQTCGSITNADTQMSTFYGKTHCLQTCKYDVKMTSLVAINIPHLRRWNT